MSSFTASESNLPSEAFFIPKKEENKMNYKEFTQQVAKEVKRFLPEKYDDASVTLQDVTKNNDQQLTGIMIKTEGSNIAPNIYLEGYYEQYQDGKDFEDIVRDIADVRVRHELNQDFDVSKITDFDQVKDHIICKLVNAEMNAEYLADKPHTQVEDLAVMYAIDLGGGEGGKMTAPITNALMEQYGVTTQELHEIALHNLSESQIEFKTMRDVLIDMMFPDGISENDPRAFMVPPEEENPSMYVLSNAERLNGAVALLDAKTMEDISEKLGGDFIVLPSSIHEVIILPKREDMDEQTLRAMVVDVNEGQVAPEERLSNNIYQYSARENRIVLANAA